MQDSGDRCRCCGGATVHGSLFLRPVRYNARMCLLCTNCVLIQNPSLFCPFCLEVFSPRHPHPRDRLMCFNCPSISHRACVASPPTRFLCPRCSDPNFSFFKVGDGESAIAIDLRAAKTLLAVARISAASVGRELAYAQKNAQLRVKDAAEARKVAKEALENLVYREEDCDFIPQEEEVEVEVEVEAEIKPKIESLPVGFRSITAQLQLENKANFSDAQKSVI